MYVWLYLCMYVCMYVQTNPFLKGPNITMRFYKNDKSSKEEAITQHFIYVHKGSVAVMYLYMYICIYVCEN